MEAIAGVLGTILRLNLTPELCCVNDKGIESSSFHLHPASSQDKWWVGLMVSESLTEEKPPFQSTFNGGVTLNMSKCSGPPFIKWKYPSAQPQELKTCLLHVYIMYITSLKPTQSISVVIELHSLSASRATTRFFFHQSFQQIALSRVI